MLACGALRSARMRLIASPADSRKNVGLMPLAFSNACAIAAHVLSGGPMYSVTLPPAWARAASGSAKAAPAASIPLKRLLEIELTRCPPAHLYGVPNIVRATPPPGQAAAIACADAARPRA